MQQQDTDSPRLAGTYSSASSTGAESSGFSFTSAEVSLPSVTATPSLTTSSQVRTPSHTSAPHVHLSLAPHGQLLELSYLVALVKNGDEDIKQQLVASLGQSVNIPGRILNQLDASTGRTALHFAAARGEHRLAHVLARQRGIDFNILDKQGNSALVLAITSMSMKTITKLLSTALSNAGAAQPIDICLYPATNPQQSPMAVALAQDAPEFMECLLLMASLADGNCRDDDVSHKVQVGCVPVRNQAHHININGTTKYGRTGQLVSQALDSHGRVPLLVALRDCKLAHASMLMDAGASLCAAEPSNAQARTYNTATSCSPGMAHGKQLASLVVPAYSSHTYSYMDPAMWHKAFNGSTPLHLIVHLIHHISLSYKLGPFEQQSDTHADSDGDADVQPISDQGAERHLSKQQHSSQQHCTRLLHQIKQAHLVFQSMLSHAEFGFAASMTDVHGNTCLHVAVIHGLQQCVESLAKQIISGRFPDVLHQRNKEHQTALDLAQAMGPAGRDCLEILRRHSFLAKPKASAQIGRSGRQFALASNVLMQFKPKTIYAKDSHKALSECGQDAVVTPSIVNGPVVRFSDDQVCGLKVTSPRDIGGSASARAVRAMFSTGNSKSRKEASTPVGHQQHQHPQHLEHNMQSLDGENGKENKKKKSTFWKSLIASLKELV